MRKNLNFLFLITVLLVIFSCGVKKETISTEEINDKKLEEKRTLLVYSGAGLKKPMDEIANLFEEQENVTIEFNYAGSGQLLAQLETTGKGDVYVVGSVPNYEAAKNKNLVSEYTVVAHHTPAIVVLKGNPKNIKKLEDLTKKDIKVILGDEKASAIGKTSQKILEKNKLEGINDNVISRGVTVNEMAVQLTTGKADAMIATVDAVFGNEELEIVKIEPDKNIDQIISGGVIEKSSKKELANKFVEFFASDKGKEIFEKYGFEPVVK